MARRCRRVLSQFAPGVPAVEPARIVLDRTRWRLTITTVPTTPYQIPTDGSCGKLISAAARMPPASGAPTAQGVRTWVRQLTAPLYFPSDSHDDDGIATAVNPELMLDLTSDDEGSDTGHLRLHPRIRVQA